jgi:ubiquinone/menaquinone biosynthesis C-methylase UbiE
VGIDISSLSIRKAVGLTPNNLRNKIDYVICDGEHLPFRPFTFDIVVVVKVLHHLSSPSKGLAEIYRVMTKHGKVVLNETLIDHPMILFGRKLIGMYKGKGAKLSSVSLCNLLSGVGFQINEMIAAEYLLTIIHTLVKIIPSLSVLFNREFLLLISKFEKFAFYRFRRMSQDVSITASKKM